MTRLSKTPEGENNAWTNNDITNYYITLPYQNVETGFWLESDRMLSLDFNPQSLEVQRQVVIEEFKQRNLNQPYGDASHCCAKWLTGTSVPLAYHRERNQPHRQRHTGRSERLLLPLLRAQQCHTFRNRAYPVRRDHPPGGEMVRTDTGAPDTSAQPARRKAPDTHPAAQRRTESPGRRLVHGIPHVQPLFAGILHIRRHHRPAFQRPFLTLYPDAGAAKETVRFHRRLHLRKPGRRPAAHHGQARAGHIAGRGGTNHLGRADKLKTSRCPPKNWKGKKPVRKRTDIQQHQLPERSHQPRLLRTDRQGGRHQH